MMRALLSVRFRSLFAGLTAQNRQKKKRSTGMMILFGVLYLYLIVVICGMMAMTFFSLAEPYHALGLDWLYFSMAGLMGIGFAIIGSVFTTQSQLYDAKDNALLLSMPIPPWAILLSRMVPLLALNLLFSGMVMIPAFVVYAIVVELSIGNLIAQFLCLLAVTVLAQAIACLFGWLLHLLLSKLNKSFASMLYMVLFLGIYFAVYSQANQILEAMAAGGQAIAGALRTWVWPIYAMGLGCLGSIPSLLAFLVIACAVFGAVYVVLSVTFLRSATMQRSSRKRQKLNLSLAKVSSPRRAITVKELRKFLGCPVYLTNMGLGIILTAALAVAGLIFRETILQVIALLEIPTSILSLVICAILAFTVSTICISTPSVSLEGKNIWILKSMPLSGKQILTGKLRFHCWMSIPVTAAAALVLTISYGCAPADCVITVLVVSLLALLCGLLGMVAGLQWARLDYISEAYPCKQSIAVLVTMFAMMGVPLVLGLLYGLLLVRFLSPVWFMAVCAVLLAAVCFCLYRVMIGWGVKKWESL